jgi:predicted transcriptional regulator
MSQSSIVSAVLRGQKSASDDVTIGGVESDVKDVLDVVSDADCKLILDVLSDDALTANELSDACNLPSSTTYRKIGKLSDTGLLEKETRYSRSGNHASEYARTVDNITIALSNEETMDSMVLDLFG